MLYQQKTFTLPASGTNISQRQWDFATLTKEKFLEKYGNDSAGYTPDEVETTVTAKVARFHPTPPVKV